MHTGPQPDADRVALSAPGPLMSRRIFDAGLAMTLAEAEHYGPAFAPPLGGRPLASAPVPVAPMWLDGGTWHLSDWRLIERRMDDLRAEGRRVTLHGAGRGYVRMRYTTLAPERFRDAEGEDAARASDDAETFGAC